MIPIVLHSIGLRLHSVRVGFWYRFALDKEDLPNLSEGTKVMAIAMFHGPIDDCAPENLATCRACVLRLTTKGGILQANPVVYMQSYA